MGQDAEEYPPRPIHVLHVLGNIDAKQGGSVRAVTGIAQTLSLIHISEPTRPY